MTQLLNYFKARNEYNRAYSELMTKFIQISDTVRADPIVSFFESYLRKLGEAFLSRSADSKLFLWGLYVFIGAYMTRKSIRILFFLWKLFSKRSIMVISRATGNRVSEGRRAAWRMTLPVDEVRGSSLAVLDTCMYAAETVGTGAMGLSLTSMILTPPEMVGTYSSPIVNIVKRLTGSLIQLRPIKMMLQYPEVCFMELPLVYAYYRWKSISSSKGKVTVTTTVNNYLGGGITKKSVTVDIAELAVGVKNATGLPFLARKFIEFYDGSQNIGMYNMTKVFIAEFIRWISSKKEEDYIQLLILAFLWPLRIAASTVTSFRLVPSVPEIRLSEKQTVQVERDLRDRPDILDSEKKTLVNKILTRAIEPKVDFSNRMISGILLPEELSLEVLRGTSILRGGDQLKELYAVNDDRFRIKLPLKPVVNNVFAFDLLKYITSDWARRIEKLMKVPPTPYAAAVELTKFACMKPIDWDYNQYSPYVGISEREFILLGLARVLKLTSADKAFVRRDYDLNPDDYLTSDTKKRHPGWKCRSLFGQTKIDCWKSANAVFAQIMSELYSGRSKHLDGHVWLFLPVVKKNASRKPEPEARCRGAVIPELYVQQCWMFMMKPFINLIKSKGDGSWLYSFELFHDKLKHIYLKFEKPGYVYSNEDKVDHGASLQLPVGDLIAEFLSRYVHFQDAPEFSRIVFDSLMQEMILGKVGLADPEGIVHVFQTTRGMKDGVYGTDKIGGLYTCIGELHKLWRFYHTDIELRTTFPDILDLISVNIGQVSGDNSLFAYPSKLHYLSGVNENTARILSEVGLTVKTEESLCVSELKQALVMSWHLDNISVGMPLIVGWKPTEEMLKGFFYPEKLLDYDFMSKTTKDYLGEIIIALYIMGFWNIEARRFLEFAWQILWKDEENHQISLRHISDLEFKTGLSQLSVDPVFTGEMHPYPPEKIVSLWFSKDIPGLITRYATNGPSPQQAASTVNGLMQIRESIDFIHGEYGEHYVGERDPRSEVRIPIECGALVDLGKDAIDISTMIGRNIQWTYLNWRYNLEEVFGLLSRTPNFPQWFGVLDLLSQLSLLLHYPQQVLLHRYRMSTNAIATLVSFFVPLYEEIVFSIANICGIPRWFLTWSQIWLETRTSSRQITWSTLETMQAERYAPFIAILLFKICFFNFFRSWTLGKRILFHMFWNIIFVLPLDLVRWFIETKMISPMVALRRTLEFYTQKP